MCARVWRKYENVYAYWAKSIHAPKWWLSDPLIVQHRKSNEYLCVCARVCRVPPMSIANIHSQSVGYQPNAYRTNFRQTIYQQIHDYDSMTTKFVVIHFFPLLLDYDLWNHNWITRLPFGGKKERERGKQIKPKKQRTPLDDGKKTENTFSMRLVLFCRCGFWCHIWFTTYQNVHRLKNHAPSYGFCGRSKSSPLIFMI